MAAVRVVVMVDGWVETWVVLLVLGKVVMSEVGKGGMKVVMWVFGWADW